MRGDHKADSGKLRKILGAKDIRLASPEDVLRITNCEVGSVHPFGLLFSLGVYMDSAIQEIDEVNFSAGTHVNSIRMKRVDMVNLIKPKIADVAKE